LAVAGASQLLPQGTVLYVVPSDRELETAVADVRFFLSAIEGLSDDAVERVVLPLPSHEVDPYRGLSPHAGVVSTRARALFGIASGRARIVVASAAALLPRVAAPERLLRVSTELKPGRDIGPTDLAELLAEAGFTREDPADEHGEFAGRGGILDLYPPDEPHPIRVEFIGDTIESLRSYDAATQRSIAAIDQVLVTPLRESFDGADAGEASIFDYLQRARASRMLVSERDEVQAQIARVSEQIQRSYEDAVSRAPARVTTPAPDLLLLDHASVHARLVYATELSQLGLGIADAAPESPSPATHVASVRSQPIAELHGRVQDWVADIRRLRDTGRPCCLSP
jgi:transcription-repair coupling factor (superfamily II helicase)